MHKITMKTTIAITKFDEIDLGEVGGGDFYEDVGRWMAHILEKMMKEDDLQGSVQKVTIYLDDSTD